MYAQFLLKRSDDAHTYDGKDRLTSVSDALGNVTRYAYDANGRKVRESHQSIAGGKKVTLATNYFYDSSDRLIKEVKVSPTGGANRAIVYEYDSLDRLVKKTIQREGAETVVEDVASFSYEPQLDAELLATANNNVAQLSFTHGATRPFSGTGFSVAATNSGNPLGLIQGNFTVQRGVTGEIESVSDSSGVLFTKSYDSAGRLTSVQSGAFNTSIGYDGFGRKSSVQHANGAVGSFTYDLLNRITSINWTGDTPITEILDYDLAGNITQVSRENGSYTLTYDAIGQLVSSSSSGQAGFVPYNRTFAYDLLGNRIQDSVNGIGTFIANFLTQNGVSGYIANPDGFGDLVQESSSGIFKNYVFRSDGRLVLFQSGSLEVGYHYDALGRRMAKTVQNGSAMFNQTFLHLGQEDRVLLGKAGNDSVTLYLDGQSIDEHLGEIKGGVVNAYLTDHLGSVLNGSLAGAAKGFGLFGELLNSMSISPTSGPVAYGFAGREHDLENPNQIYLRNRYFDAVIGRFTSQDPLGAESGDLNYYRYAFNNPIIYTDPEGLGVGTRVLTTYFGVTPLAVCLGTVGGSELNTGEDVEVKLWIATQELELKLRELERKNFTKLPRPGDSGYLPIINQPQSIGNHGPGGYKSIEQIKQETNYIIYR